MARKKKISRVQELVYELKVSDAMTRNVISVTLTTWMSNLRQVLRDNLISGAPVIDGDQLVGVISIEDFITWLAEGGEDCLICEKMSRKIETLYADEPLVNAVDKFERCGFGRFPVVERGGRKLVGILTKGDIVEGLLKRLEIDYHEEEIHRYRASHIFEDLIADNMSLTLEYHVAGQDFKGAGRSTSELKRALRRLSIHPRIVRRVAIASYEAEMNIIVFAEHGDIVVEVEPAQIRVEAKDSGPGIPDIEKAMQVGYSTAPDWVRELGFGAGMGLSNIQKCADEMNLTSKVGEGTCLKIIIKMGEKERDNGRLENGSSVEDPTPHVRSGQGSPDEGRRAPLGRKAL